MRPCRRVDHPPAVDTHHPAGPRCSHRRGAHQGSPHSCTDYTFALFFHRLMCTRRCPTPVLRLVARLSPWCSSLGPSGGGGGVGGRRGHGGVDRGTPTQAPTPALIPLLGVAPWPTFTNPWSGRISMWPLAQSVSTVGLTPPVDTEWITDSGASYHTTPDVGILSSVWHPHPSSFFHHGR
jgi:hypothetical protein